MSNGPKEKAFEFFWVFLTIQLISNPNAGPFSTDSTSLRNSSKNGGVGCRCNCKTHYFFIASVANCTLLATKLLATKWQRKRSPQAKKKEPVSVRLGRKAGAAFFALQILHLKTSVRNSAVLPYLFLKTRS